MTRIAESELIINPQGTIYHLNLRPEELAHLIITVGDPDRVRVVSQHLDRLEWKTQHREFVTHTGYLGRHRLSVVSTGIGTDNIDIVLNELDALVNIDFKTRMPKPELTRLRIIRLGTSGALQEGIPVDSFVTSTHGLGIDNLLNFYRPEASEEDKQILQSFITQTQIHHQAAQPYISGASSSMLKHFVEGFHCGITVTCPGFYGPQGRVLRLPLRNPDLIDSFARFRSGQHRICNFEMETSGLYGLGKLLGHHCLSLSAIVANRITREFSSNPQAAIERLIAKALDIIREW
jgi:uridine phosphorylase